MMLLSMYCVIQERCGCESLPGYTFLPRYKIPARGVMVGDGRCHKIDETVKLTVNMDLFSRLWDKDTHPWLFLAVHSDTYH